MELQKQAQEVRIAQDHIKRLNIPELTDVGPQYTPHAQDWTSNDKMFQVL